MVDVDKNALLRITGIEGEHPLIDVLLKAFAAIARGDSTTRCSSEQTSLDPLGLRVSWPCNILHDDTPFTVSIHCTKGTGVEDVAGADVSFVSDPVALFKSLAVIIRVVEMILR